MHNNSALATQLDGPHWQDRTTKFDCNGGEPTRWKNEPKSSQQNRRPTVNEFREHKFRMQRKDQISITILLRISLLPLMGLPCIAQPQITCNLLPLSQPILILERSSLDRCLPDRCSPNRSNGQMRSADVRRQDDATDVSHRAQYPLLPFFTQLSHISRWRWWNRRQ